MRLKHRYGRRAVRVTTGTDDLQQHEFELDGLADNAEFLAALRQPVIPPGLLTL